MNKHAKLITNARVCLPEGLLEGGSVLVQDGVIVHIADHRQDNLAADEVIDAKGAYVVPGFIDVHVHGGGGFDVMSGEPSHIEGMSRFHASKGTTALLPTTLTHSCAKIEAALDGIVTVMDKGTSGAEIVGIHLEGPYLNVEKCGAQNPEHIRPGNIEELQHFLTRSKGNVRLMTIAPEIGDALEVIEFAVKQGVTVSIGHSNTTFDVMEQAVRKGATHVTHLFNGMSPLHHREPGVAGAALMLDELAVELICDGFHLHQDIIRFVFRTKPMEQIVLITDCIAAGGCQDGQYELGDLPLMMQSGVARLLNEDGTLGSLAGSCLTMDQALRNTMAYTGLSLVEVIPTLTLNPARQIGLEQRKGSIAVGKDADLVFLNDQIEVIATYVKGQKVYEQE